MVEADRCLGGKVMLAGTKRRLPCIGIGGGTSPENRPETRMDARSMKFGETQLLEKLLRWWSSDNRIADRL